MVSRDAQRLESLLEAARLLSSKLELPELLTTVLRLASRVVDAETASLLLLDEATQELYFDVALGLEDGLSQVRLKLGQGVAGSVAQTRKPEIINEVRADPRWSPRMDERTGFVTRSILAVPLLLKGRLLGVVEAINKRDDGAFAEADVEEFEAFASQAAIAIDNARLFSSLRDEKFKLATVFAQMHDGAALTDAAGRVLLANEAASRLLGAGHSELAAALRGMTVAPPLAELLVASASDASFVATRAEPTLLVIAGRMTRAPLADGEGRLFVFRDDTEAARQERLKSSFLSLISHKLKTPLASVIGFSDVLLSEAARGEADSMTSKALRIINAQGLKVGELVDKLIRYTTLESPDAAPALADASVDEAVAEALKGLREKIDAKRASVEYAPSGLSLRADREMLVEVVKNLVENALKFDPKPSPVVAVRASAEGDWISLSVADRGPGIPPEAHRAVFSRFHQVEKDFTGQQDGMGLGLPFVKKVAELHGGTATLSSRLGEGTTVTVTWPRRGPR